MNTELLLVVHLLLWAASVIGDINCAHRGSVCNPAVGYDDSIEAINWTVPEAPRPNFKIALIAAGHIRTFAAVKESWLRYIIEPWEHKTHLFAVVNTDRSCELSSIGVEYLRSLTTEMEVSDSHAAVYSEYDFDERFNKNFKCYEFLKRKTKGFSRIHGLIADMYAQRTRAFHMAMGYATRNKFKWDLIVLLRFDSAFYTPKLEFYKFYDILKERRVEGRRNIIIPRGCRFAGMNDRFAIGLAEEMGVYFEKDWLAKMSHILAGKVVDLDPIYVARGVLNDTKSACSSEVIVRDWLYGINNISALHVDRTITFSTVRPYTAIAYCERNRLEAPRGFHYSDFMCAFDGHGAGDITDDDKVSSSAFRCGSDFTKNHNITNICETNQLCHCVKVSDVNEVVRS